MKIFDHNGFPILYALVRIFQLPNKSETVVLIFYRLDKTGMNSRHYIIVCINAADDTQYINLNIVNINIK